MKSIKIVLLFFAGVFFLSSCSTIIKRHYRKGFYVEHKKQINNTYNIKLPNDFKNIPAEKLSNETLSDNDSVGFCDNKHDLKKTKKEPIVLKPFSAVKSIIAQRNIIKQSFHAKAQKLTDPENDLVAKTLSLFWIVLLIILLLYLGVLLFAGDSLLPLGHLLGIAFAALLLLWLMRVI